MQAVRLEPIDVPLYDPRAEHDACGVGFIAAVDGRHAGRTIPMALEALAALAHRGARGADDATGDGAGISIPITPQFLARVVGEAGLRMPPRTRIAVAMCFLPTADPSGASELVERSIAQAGLRVAGWRDVPVDMSLVAGRRIGETPVVRQALVVAERRMGPLALERALAVARRTIDRSASATAGMEGLSVASLSARTVVYKGLFVGDELGRFYADLRADDLAPRYAIFHQRYSTNTFPSWALAQPFAYLAHNGEINTIRSNREAMRGRQRSLGRGAWARRMAAIGPLVSMDGSDSRALDDAVELLVLSGLSVDAALGTLVPAAEGLGGPVEHLPRRVEPWDGPAALVFGDGQRVGALLDRNGLRPLAMTTTHDGLVVVSSEAGSVELDARPVARRHRLGPGSMVVVDIASGSVMGPATAEPPPVATVARRPILRTATPTPGSDIRGRFASGLDAETVRQVVKPMAAEGREATWSMGDDTPLAPLATKPRRISAYLRQSFAQVTNPAIDPLRERAVMSVRMTIGRQPALVGGTGAVVVEIDGPVLDEAGWAGVIDAFGARRVAQVDATWPVAHGRGGLARALDRLARRARAAARRGDVVLVLSDRRAGPGRVAIPPILAVGRVNQALVAAGVRTRCDVMVEAAECFDVHDVAMLLAAGASAVHPWLLLEVAGEQAGVRGLEALDPDGARQNTLTALDAGLAKVLARMGISTLASYRGGQLFDVIGLDPQLAATCFPAAPSWPGTAGFREIERTLIERHRTAYAETAPALEDLGLVRFRGSGERHAFAPRVVKATQAMAEVGDTDGRLDAYRAAVTDGEPRQPRDLLALTPAGPPIPLDEVEPATNIVRRFVSSAMSLGALSPEAHQAISIGMARLGAASNSGEGGEDPGWYIPSADHDRRDAAIKQIASARFGVTAEYLARADQLEIKIAQGSKPGEGGQLPGQKATPLIAALRRGQPGMTMVSPPPHHDIYSIEDLAQLIADLRAVNPMARIGVKLVAGAGIGTIAVGVAKAHADYIMISGHSGGTGASPLSSIKHAGLPWELGLAEAHQVLLRSRLRDRVTLRTDGGLQTGRDVVVAAALGAEEFGFGTAALVAIGCDMARQCHLDTCPTGIATQREDLRAKFTGTPEQVVAFFTAIATDVRHELAGLGLRTLGELVGRGDLLAVTARSPLDLERAISAPVWVADGDLVTPPKDRAPTGCPPVDRAFEAALVPELVRRVEAGERITISQRVTPADRSVGARLAGALSRRPEPRHLPHVTYALSGSAGQSLGAFAVAGMRISLDGEANDYVGKGLSGGAVIVRSGQAQGGPSDQALVGNVCLYGATAGTLHVVGQAGMRFAVRNSGARAVVEGVGAHGCEYMTGGVVVVLGDIGPNFGAGMTGGRAFLLDSSTVEGRLNLESVRPRAIERADERVLRELVEAHADEGSERAASLLAAWDPRRFVVVEPLASVGLSIEKAEAPADPVAMAR